jgi:RNA polymerase sigma-70 factor (TIGR02943 family)
LCTWQSMNDQSSQTKSKQIDPASWVDSHGDYLYRFALSRLRDPDAAEEVVQEAMFSALKNVGQFAGRGGERAWLLGILKLKIIDVYRKRKRDPINADEDSSDLANLLFDQNGSWKKEVRSAMRSSLDSLEREDFWKILKICLQSLPQRQSDVFSLRVMDEESAENICKELDITSTNYWVLLHRARLQLSSCMKQRWFEESKI